MAQLTVRNVPEEVVRRLKIRAAEHGRSAESEHREILSQSLLQDDTGFWKKAARLRKKLPRQTTDSAELLRQLRDER